MKQIIGLIVVCCILYAFATEYTTSGSCPNNITPMATFPLSGLDGDYMAAAYLANQVPIIGADRPCYKIRFAPITDNRTDVKVISKVGFFPMSVNMRFTSTAENGTFAMMDSVFGTLFLGESYILANETTHMLYYSCRNGINDHAIEVLVLTTTNPPTYTDAMKTSVETVMKTNNLPYRLMTAVNHARETCNGVNL